MDKKTIFKIVFLMGLTVAFVATSYSWFAEKSNPSISESQIKVAAAEGLVIKLQADSAGRTNVNLNTIISDFEEFELKQVSSASALDFYTIDFGEGLTMSNPKYVLLPPVNNSDEQMIANGYVDYDFYLQTEDMPKHVYLHRDTSFDGPASNSIRFSVAYSFTGEETIIIFGDKAENGILDDYTTKAIIKEGDFTYGNTDPSFYTNQLVREYDYKDGGRSNSDEDPINLDKIFFTLPANTMIKVNIKIWLEGGDIDCTNTIASTFLDAVIKFGSANILRDAPAVYANVNNFTITNLTTEMEWATTNTSTTTWNAVTNPNMSFVGYNTVYVRYKAASDGSTTESYATPVNFG